MDDDFDSFMEKEFLKFDNLIKKYIEPELHSLPCWAKVAFASRCAKRILPLCENTWGKILSKEEVNCWQEAITVSEKSAENAKYTWAVPQIEWITLTHALLIDPLPIHAALEAAYIAGGNKSMYRENLNDAVLATVRYCVGNTAIRQECSDDIFDAMYADLKLLVKMSNKNAWDDETAIHPEIFGDMWSKGTPKNW